MHETRVPGALTTNAGSATHARRPGAVTILAVLQLLNAAFFGLIFLGLLADGSSVLEALSGEAGAGAEPVSEIAVATVSILVGGFGIAASAAGILLLRMRQLGWTVTMLLAGLGLASSIYFWWAQGTTVTIWVMVQVLTVFYLNQGQVRVAFGISRRRASDTFDQGRG